MFDKLGGVDSLGFRGYAAAWVQASRTARISSWVGWSGTSGRYWAAIRTRRSLTIMPDRPVLYPLHVAREERHRPIEVAVATWPGPVTVLVEEYRVPSQPADVNGLPPSLG